MMNREQDSQTALTKDQATQSDDAPVTIGFQ